MIWCENQRARALASNPIFHGRTKHIELDIHFVREQMAAKHLTVQFVPFEYQVANIFKKPLSLNLFYMLRSKLNMANYKLLLKRKAVEKCELGKKEVYKSKTLTCQLIDKTNIEIGIMKRY